jgi:hypothetical protein
MPARWVSLLANTSWCRLDIADQTVDKAAETRKEQEKVVDARVLNLSINSGTISVQRLCSPALAY